MGHVSQPDRQVRKELEQQTVLLRASQQWYWRLVAFIVAAATVTRSVSE